MPIVNIKDYGAVGNGSTDDTKALISAAIASDQVFLPDGAYKIGNFAFPRSYVHLFGAGRERTILLDGGGTTPVIDGSSRCFISCIDKTDCGIHNLTIKGRGALDQETVGLGIHAAPKFNCESVVVELFRGRGIWLHHELTANCTFTNILVQKILETQKQLYGIGVWLYGGGNFGAPSNCTFSNLTVNDCSNSGLHLDAGTSSGPGHPPFSNLFTCLKIRDCATITRGGAAAIGFSGAQNNVISGLCVSWTVRPTGPVLVFAKDQSGVSCGNNIVTGGVFQQCWNPPIAQDKSDMTNQVTSINVAPYGNSFRQIQMEKW